MRGRSTRVKARAVQLLATGVLLLSAIQSQAADTPPYHEVASTSLYVPVRDGTRLAVSIYRPAENGVAVSTPYPVIFVFTPYRARYRDE
jgi:predicted acyl esterase